MISGGGARKDLRPLQRDGNLTPGFRGSHRGNAESLNVKLAPGMVPYWCRHPNSDRGAAQIQRFLNDGWEVAPPESQIQRQRPNDPNYAAMGLDRYQAHGDIVLLQIPEERYKEVQARKAQLREAAVDGPTRDFLHKGEPLQHRYGQSADGPIYYVGHGHGRSSE
jgi:hypothetical protein